MIERTEKPDKKSKWLERWYHFKEQQRRGSRKDQPEEGWQKVKRPVEFIINIKVKTGASSFDAPALLDSRA